MTRRSVPAALVAAACIVNGCIAFPFPVDSELRLEPRDWKAQPDYTWSRDLEGCSLWTTTIKVFPSTTYVTHFSHDFELRGNSRSVRLESATLETNTGGRYDGRISRFSLGHSSVEWELYQPVGKALGDRAEMVLELRVGSEPREVRIEWAAEEEPR